MVEPVRQRSGEVDAHPAELPLAERDVERRLGERGGIERRRVVAGRITKERWVEIIATAPAKLFGMYPRKGALAVGSDADIVIYDPRASRTISAKTHHMDVDYSCYEGRAVQGRSDVVLSRGSVIVRDGQFTGKKGAGTFVKRAPADYARIS